jgi:hypothetical protein
MISKCLLKFVEMHLADHNKSLLLATVWLAGRYHKRVKCIYQRENDAYIYTTCFFQAVTYCLLTLKDNTVFSVNG